MSRYGAVVVLTFVLLWMSAPRAPWSGPACVAVAAAQTLVHEHTLDLIAHDSSCRTGSLEADSLVVRGRRWPTRLPVAALWLMPSTVSRAPLLAQLFACASSALALALLCGLLLTSLIEFGIAPPLAMVSALVLPWVTQLSYAGRFPDGEAVAAVALYGGARCIRRADATGRRVFISGCLFALALLHDPVLLVPALVLLFAQRSRRTWLALVPLVVAIGALLAYALWLGTSWPYRADGDWWTGVDGLLMSTGKSLLVYSPLLVLLVWVLGDAQAPPIARNRARTAAVATVATVLVLGAGADWHGDPAWGPRRLTPLVSLLAEPILLWLWALPLTGWRELPTRIKSGALLAGFGLVVSILGALFAPTSYLDLLTQLRLHTGAPAWFAQPASEAHFIPQFSPLIGHAWMAAHLGDLARAADVHPPWALIVPTAPRLGIFQVRVDWWLLELFSGALDRTTKWVGAAIGFSCACALVAATTQLVLKQRGERSG